MELLELLRRRRSVRRYSGGAVPREIIERCLEAARVAPSACNSQPWRFIVVDDPDLKNTLAEAAFSGIYSMNSFAGKAPVLIVVVRERSKYAARLGGYFRGVKYSLIDIGIACQQLILQAEAEGVGTCWLGWLNERAVKRVLGLPRRVKVDVMISVGYPESGAEGDNDRKSLDEIRAYNT